MHPKMVARLVGIWREKNKTSPGTADVWAITQKAKMTDEDWSAFMDGIVKSKRRGQ